MTMTSCKLSCRNDAADLEKEVAQISAEIEVITMVLVNSFGELIATDTIPVIGANNEEHFLDAVNSLDNTQNLPLLVSNLNRTKDWDKEIESNDFLSPREIATKVHNILVIRENIGWKYLTTKRSYRQTDKVVA